MKENGKRGWQAGGESARDGDRGEENITGMETYSKLYEYKTLSKATRKKRYAIRKERTRTQQKS